MTNELEIIKRALVEILSAGSITRAHKAFAAVELLEAERQAAVESAAVTARRIVTAWIDPKSYKLQPEHEQELQAAIAAALAERQSDTEILDWMEDNPGVALKYGLGGKLWRAVDALEKGYHRNIIASGKTLRETARGAMQSTKENANE